MTVNGKIGAVLVVGGGIGGIQASLDLADSGFKVYLLEKAPSIGGVMAQLDKTFPTNDCSMCILAPKLVSVARHPNIELITNAEIDKLKGDAGNFTVAVKKKPRYVDEEKCTGCGVCMENCPVRKALYPVEEVPLPSLEEKDIQKIKAIIEEHRQEMGRLMPVLQHISRDYNYLPPDLLRHVSKELNIPLTNICNIATFYNAFSLTPRGRHQISVCMGTTCYVRGGERILEKLSEKLEIAPGETTKDMRFTLYSVRCLGCCSIAPAIMIDGKAYGKIRLSRIPSVLRNYQ
ncbi:NAD(P)H-dependent oxidoreductase subunit E [candidate division WOR-3 bacterium]|nr:NAD(P)H-dependent oxidoreductase subunit E [candidate division WOR-3 bacterium]